jgi:ribosomal-protein-alanine N-acetyltransferase
MISMKLTGQIPRLETERLILRELTLGDKDAVFQNFSDDETTEFIMEPMTSLKQAEDIIQEFIDGFKQGKSIFWAVVLKESYAFIGTCSYESFSLGDLQGEIGYDLSKGYWGQGLMTEAVQAIIRYGFECLGLNRIEPHTFPQNTRSISLLCRLHFKEEGTFRQNSYFKGKFWDEVFSRC